MRAPVVCSCGVMFHCWGGPAMKFTVDHDDNVVIFTLKEQRLDSSTAPEIKAELLIVCQPTISALVVDLSRVDYADSSGLSALLLAYRQLRDTTSLLHLSVCARRFGTFSASRRWSGSLGSTPLSRWQCKSCKPRVAPNSGHPGHARRREGVILLRSGIQ